MLNQFYFMGSDPCTSFENCYWENTADNTQPSHLSYSPTTPWIVTSTLPDTQTYRLYCQGVGATHHRTGKVSVAHTGHVLSVKTVTMNVKRPTFDDTTIFTSTQYSMTEFSTGVFTTTPSGLAVTYEVSSVSGSVTAPSGLNAVVTDGSNIKITPSDATSAGWMRH